MATLEASDVLESASLKLNPQGDYETTRTFIVSSVTGSAHERLYNALQVSGIPAKGTVHPYASLNTLYADEYTVTPEDSSNGIFKVVVTYKPQTGDNAPPSDNNLGQISLGTSVQSQTTNKDVNGVDMVLTYKTQTQIAEVEVQMPMTVAKFTRREYSHPLQKSFDFVGKTNSQAWQGYGRGYWLCTGINGETSDGGSTYSVTYEFQANRAGWNPTVYYIDPETNAPPEDVLSNPTAFKIVTQYLEANFNTLKLV